MTAETIFEIFDKNKDGILSFDEFRDAILDYSPSYPQEKIERRFKEMDVNGNGQIDVNVFVSWFEKMLKRSFTICDVDGDGKVTAKELHSAMTTMGRACTEESCAEKIRAFDSNNDGCLNYEEFKAMLFRFHDVPFIFRSSNNV